MLQLHSTTEAEATRSMGASAHMSAQFAADNASSALICGNCHIMQWQPTCTTAALRTASMYCRLMSSMSPASSAFRAFSTACSWLLASAASARAFFSCRGELKISKNAAACTSVWCGVSFPVVCRVTRCYIRSIHGSCTLATQDNV